MPPTIDRALHRVRGEYVEMPGLCLTPEQIQRLCGIEPDVCEMVLETLVKTKFLRVTKNRTYVLEPS